MSRAGYVTFELAPALVKGFDWKQKVAINLTSVDLGTILASADGNVHIVREPYRTCLAFP